MENEIDEYGSKYILTAIKTQVFSLHDESTCVCL